MSTKKATKKATKKTAKKAVKKTTKKAAPKAKKTASRKTVAKKTVKKAHRPTPATAAVVDALQSPQAPEPAPVDQRALTNHFAIVLDRSSSMQSVQDEAIKVSNDNIRTIQDQVGQSGQKSTVSFWTFADEVQEVSVGTVIGSGPAPWLTRDTYRPLGNTALWDGVGKAIQRLSTFPDAGNVDTSFMVIVVTDGEENQSRLFSAPELLRMIDRQQGTDRWSFVFCVPPGKGEALARKLGIPMGNIKEWERTREGTRYMGESVTRGLAGYFEGRRRGARSTKGFFNTDASKISASQVKKNLTDISGQVKIWTVEAECPIQSFVEVKGRSYEIGKAYYQLTKDETVQGHKLLMLMRKGEKAVYGGQEARDMLGLPTHDVKVRPGNHGEWDIFVQSTSTNRKLVRGSKLIYVTG